MKRFFALFLFAVSVFLHISICSIPVLASEPSVSAQSACLIDDRGRTVYEKNADAVMPMASTTKIMTALVVIEKGDLDRVVTVSDLSIGVEGSSIYLTKGERLSIKDLLYALLLQSANDAAVALACAVSQSVREFVELMNNKAAELGLKNTHFANPSGLDAPEHHTTARELAQLTAYAMKNETFFKIVSCLKYTYATDKRSGLFVNHNKLLYSMEDCVGVKTGYTQRSGRCLVSATEKDGLMLVGVTLNAPGDWQDHKAMHKYGRGLYELESWGAKGQMCFSVPVVNGVKSEIFLTNASELSNWNYKDENIKAVTELDRFLYAPVEKGQVCGRVVLICDGREIQSCDIIALEECRERKFTGLWERIVNKIRGLFKWKK